MHSSTALLSMVDLVRPHLLVDLSGLAWYPSCPITSGKLPSSWLQCTLGVIYLCVGHLSGVFTTSHHHLCSTEVSSAFLLSSARSVTTSTNIERHSHRPRYQISIITALAFPWVARPNGVLALFRKVLPTAFTRSTRGEIDQTNKTFTTRQYHCSVVILTLIMCNTGMYVLMLILSSSLLSLSLLDWLMSDLLMLSLLIDQTSAGSMNSAGSHYSQLIAPLPQ